jgi:hypothetical protein
MPHEINQCPSNEQHGGPNPSARNAFNNLHPGSALPLRFKYNKTSAIFPYFQPLKVDLNRMGKAFGDLMNTIEVIM